MSGRTGGDRPLRVGLIGAGMIAGCHARAYAATPGVDIVAVADTRRAKAEHLAATVGARPCPDLAGVLAHGVDVVSVCTPPHTHADLTLAALAAGTHVLCEKPVAATIADARRIRDAGRQAVGLLMIGHVSRFEPDHRAAAQLVADGHVGQVAMMVHSMTTSMPMWSEGGWLGRPEESGGPLLDLSVHSFDYCAWVSGSRAVRVHAVAADSAVGPATYAISTVRYQSGALAQIEASWAHPSARGFKAVVEITGRHGRVNWDYDSINGGVMHAEGAAPSWFDPLGERGYEAEVAAFVDAIRTGNPSPVPVEAGYEATRTALAAHESLRTGQPVDLTCWETA